jgi:8-oxo-dGTP pyrophosphatase MutT (NUDIX family)
VQPSAADSGDELVEWVDEHDRVIDVVPRARMRHENLRHRSAAVVVLSGDGRLLVHRRSNTKDLRPGWWDVCAGGVVGVGESYLEAAARELAEEMGVTGVPLQPLGVGRFDDVDSREISHLFLATSDGPFEFADGEVAEARLVTRDELTVLMDRERFLPTCDAMILPLVAGFEPT